MFEYNQIVHNKTKNAPHDVGDRWEMEQYKDGLVPYVLKNPELPYDFAACRLDNKDFMIYYNRIVLPRNIEVAKQLLDEGFIIPDPRSE